ncbi:glycerophosphodiester phosphodiesterase family protein [Actinacidiphila sp. ITFR-21]|uniref:glycerophosphodiester phosphodiesterase family protein n=1 Tax=Actinacidiphila sp. ITFR-21 TaxID=3075199 RepID=UPI00288B95FF|nr:glycerophosphodiester phosphodiesterase family protein [Streptomyces sp. ITFR-21]WNI16535.1 glycerophosphodiester phosphodiesterase family protein [Streptomyces sp. ITFR-21]
MTFASAVPGADPAARPVQVVAHRGASEDVPEHTLAAYRKAIEYGADALECDVRLTADGHLVCVHDWRVNRTSNGRGAVSSLELADLAALDFGSWKGQHADPEAPERYRQAGGTGGPGGVVGAVGADWAVGADEESSRVLTLQRLLELLADTDRRVELAIETKHPTRWAGQVEERLLELLRRFGLDRPPPGEPSRVRVMSFSSRSLRRVRLGAPDLPTVYLMQYVSPRHRDGRLPAGVRIAGPSMRIVRANPGYVARLHRAGHRVHVWTVDEPADVELCVRLGVDAVITNRPRQVLAQLGR